MGPPCCVFFLGAPVFVHRHVMQCEQFPAPIFSLPGRWAFGGAFHSQCLQQHLAFGWMACLDCQPVVYSCVSERSWLTHGFAGVSPSTESLRDCRNGPFRGSIKVPEKVWTLLGRLSRTADALWCSWSLFVALSLLWHIFCLARRRMIHNETQAKQQLSEVERWQPARAAWSPVIQAGTVFTGASLEPWEHMNLPNLPCPGAVFSRGRARLGGELALDLRWRSKHATTKLNKLISWWQMHTPRGGYESLIRSTLACGKLTA